MMAWLQEDNWAAIEDELFGRGVSTSECYTEWLTVCDALIYDTRRVPVEREIINVYDVFEI